MTATSASEPEPCVVEQVLHRVAQHGHLRHHDRAGEEQREQQCPEGERLHDGAGVLAAGAGVRPAEVQRPGRERPDGPDDGQAEARDVEQGVARLDAQRERQHRRPQDERDDRDDPASAEGRVALGVVARHRRDQGGPDELADLQHRVEAAARPSDGSAHRRTDS